jgi:DNA-binding transcriptional regulator YdaS (Cro superfamily)
MLVSDMIKQAAELSGGMSALARQIGVSKSAPYSWVQVPASRVLAIEAATGGQLDRYTMRPDLYPRD